MKLSLLWFIHENIILSSFRFLLDISSFQFAPIGLELHQIREVYHSRLSLFRSLGIA